MTKSRSRFQYGLFMLTGFFLLAALFAILLYALTPETPVLRGPILLAAFIAILLGSLVCMMFLLRWLLRPYNQLIGEAERASTARQLLKSQDEAEFVLETFQSVVAQLQEQRKALEQLSAEARERATSAEKFSERIVASLPSGLVAFDANGLSLVINTPGRTLLGVDGRALGESYETLLANHAELAAMVGDCLKQGTLYRRSEVEARTPQGQLLRLGATIAPIELAPDRSRAAGSAGVSPASRGALCLLTDITEVTELREQVALKNNLESLGEMSAGLAHEFKNAIATLQGYAQLLQTLELNDKAQVAAASLLNEVRNLAAMVTAFLNFARPQPLQLEDTDLHGLITDCAVELEPLFEERRVQLVVEKGGSSLINMRADERMLRSALLNLMRNACEAIPPEKAERSVVVRTRKDGQFASIEVRDTGTGIPTSQLQKIFIPFFTTKPKGHGVGLALTHRVITEHGGTLTAANLPEGGAVFTIKIPVGNTHASDDPPAA